MSLPQPLNANAVNATEVNNPKMAAERQNTIGVCRYHCAMAMLLLAHPLFLAASPDEQSASSPYFPLGLLYLASWVRQLGHDVAIFDGTFEAGPEAFAAALDAHQPDLVGVSALLPTRDSALHLCEMASSRGAVVVVGGPDPTADPTPYLAADAVDVVVHHEGEQTIARLLELFDDANLTIEALMSEPGIAFRNNGVAVVNEPRPPIENLDELPLPARDLIDMDRYLQTWEDENGYRSMTISTTRGCPYSCKWCTDAVHGSGFRQRSPESVAAEVATLNATFDIGRLRMVDDVDAIDRGWLDDWAAAVEDEGAAIRFEALNELERQDIPLLDVRDSL
ncbi:MAG: anaerobic magnesium-protoporphyrin IX monomethyl ester cyclase [Verrucomicrobiales bacterium]